MKLNKKFLLVLLALIYLLVVQKIITSYLFPTTDFNITLSQLNQEILPYRIIIKIAIFLIALSVLVVFVVLKNNLRTDLSPIPPEMFIILILIFSAVIPALALLNILLTGDILFSPILLIYGVIFTSVVYIKDNENTT
ncbi:hypothetical protein [Methanobacterium formicicum]|uniref:Uncharacterized protein n=1 Tax=Methanobacterium formicicum (strain DSM 3637 / PP1) TaxID=1204725 RepID=K2R2R2_METFP|nr:hypothetical protein [Methanobacterium formicicum]EKF85507.1 hypothetical protein A994_08736 [Methanobacterium formicicum DSM 3637]